MHTNKNHDHWMRLALDQAQHAKQKNEVPVGAVVVLNNEIIATGYNQPISSHDPTAHAEIIALREAGLRLKNYRLLSATMYVTLEPCMMCYWAMVHARIDCCIFGASDRKVGVFTNKLTNHVHKNHTLEHKSGVLGDQCQSILTDFFRSKRQ